MNFVLFFGFLSIMLSPSHDLGRRYGWMTQIVFYVVFFFFKNFFFLKLNFVFFPVFPSIKLSRSDDLTHEFLWPHLGLPVLFFFRPVLFTDFFFRFQPSAFRFLGIDNRNFLNLFPRVESWIVFYFLKYTNSAW
jgi:hypothetical protein